MKVLDSLRFRSLIIFLLLFANAPVSAQFNDRGAGALSDNNLPQANGMIVSERDFNRTLLTPNGWGSTENFLFASFDCTPNAVYSSTCDGIARLGFGVGNAENGVSFVGVVNVNGIEKMNNVSYTFIMSRAVGEWTSVSVGAEHFFRSPISDGIPSLYAAFSGYFTAVGEYDIVPRLSYSIGIGSGRFYTKSPLDVLHGRGQHGTAVFGSLSYDLTDRAGTSIEWTGTNLTISGYYRLPAEWPALYLGVSKLTRYSGDHPMIVFGIGKALGFKKRKEY